ncbi:LSM-domain-containing protein [Mollisia scopiformis]|uniref:Sm protein F n=1 Tax=Mollisia scopiformis TaxID=149040 RepID=A0A194XSG4_MOLSC|nr:LSM-domain-containing protein [Mollisia scopiformis]KUJ23138.1 LSM-domain-containing protein [Mollisia scopiformis]
MLSLTLTADLSGVTELRPDDTADNPFWYTFKVQCTSCRENHSNNVSVSRFEQNEMSGSRGEANFVWKCQFCKRESSATIKAAPIAYQQASPPTRQKILEIDCRGLEFTEFHPEGEWLATGLESGTKFTAIDLSEGDWFDYDEKAGDEFMPINPRPMLQNLVNEEVVIRLKWGQTEYKGRLVSIDSYMNIQLSGAEEWIDQEMTSVLGQVLIRCNNVLWIQGANQNNGNGDTKMDG